MYTDFFNQLYQWIHYITACFLLFILFPRLIFTLPADRFFERTAALALRSIFWMILTAYVLIFLKLFEVLALLAILFICFLSKSLLSLNKQKRETTSFVLATHFFDWVDGFAKPLSIVKKKMADGISRAKEFWNVLTLNPVEYVMLSVVLGLSVYVRLYDALHHPAPAMSDSYVTMAWMKYADERQLFVDGIYPQGYYYILCYLLKFSGIDALYVLRFTGPITNWLTVCLIFVIVKRLSGSLMSGILAAAMTGVFGYTFAGATGWSRQAASLSQEYSFFLLLTALYFFNRWIIRGEKVDYRTGVIGASAVGLVHAVGYGFLWLGVGALMLADLLHNRKACYQRLFKVGIAGGISAIISILPAVLGLVFGKHFHANSLNFTFEVTKVSLPPIRTIDLIALGSSVLLLLSSFYGPKARKISESFIAFLGIGTFVLYEYAGWWTQKEMIATRSPDLWGLIVPITIGMGASVVFRFLTHLSISNVIQKGILALVLFGTLVVYPPHPIFSDKLESDEGINQYLKIRSSFTPKSWMIVYSLREANNLVRGKGYQMYVGPKIGNVDAPSFFLGNYDPSKPNLTKYGETKSDSSIGHDVFIFYEKQIYKLQSLNQLGVDGSKYLEYQTRELDMKNLRVWLDHYEKANGPLDVFYDGPTLTVYHIINNQH